VKISSIFVAFLKDMNFQMANNCVKILFSNKFGLRLTKLTYIFRRRCPNIGIQ
jgi:hypothetical protein